MRGVALFLSEATTAREADAHAEVVVFSDSPPRGGTARAVGFSERVHWRQCAVRCAAQPFSRRRDPIRSARDARGPSGQERTARDAGGTSSVGSRASRSLLFSVASVDCVGEARLHENASARYALMNRERAFGASTASPGSAEAQQGCTKRATSITAVAEASTDVGAHVRRNLGLDGHGGGEAAR